MKFWFPGKFFQYPMHNSKKFIGVRVWSDTCQIADAHAWILLLTSAFMEYWGRAWADYYCDNSYIASSASDASALLVRMASIHPHATNTQAHSKFSVAPVLLPVYYRNATNQQYSPEAHRSLLPGSYRSTYLSSSIIFHGSPRVSQSPIGIPSPISSRYSCKSRTWARQYTGEFHGVHGSREPAWTNAGE